MDQAWFLKGEASWILFLIGTASNIDQYLETGMLLLLLLLLVVVMRMAIY